MKSVICVGAATIDRELKTLSAHQLHTSNPVTSTSSFGGVARNVADHLSRWTTQVALYTAMGDDADGQALSQYMQNRHVDLHVQILSGYQTAQYYAVVNHDGELVIALAEMAIFNHIDTANFVASFAKWPKHSIVMLDTNFSNFIIEKCIQYCFENHLYLCVDPVSSFKAKRLPACLQGVYMLKPDQYEATALTGISIHSVEDAIKAGKILFLRGVKNVIISMGAAGYVLVNDTIQAHVNIKIPNNIIDVSGAGDAFMAGFIFGLQQEVAIETACVYGEAAAFYTIQVAETVPSTISREALITYLHFQSISGINNEHIL